MTSRVEPLTGVLGAEIIGLDLAAADATMADAVVAALDEHLVVVIRDQQHLAIDEQVQFTRLLGPAAPTPFVGTMPDHPDVIRVVKEAAEADAFNFGGGWHSDFSFLSPPPSYTLLRGIELPRFGGDTVFTSMVAACAALPPDLDWLRDGAAGVHTARDAYSPRLQEMHSGLGSMDIQTDESAYETTTHPLFTKQERTGRTILFYNQTYCRDLAGPSVDGRADDVRRALRRLHQHSTDHRFTYRHRWLPGDLVIWDNRATQHYAINDYGGHRRELHRTTVAGTVPVAA